MCRGVFWANKDEGDQYGPPTTLRTLMRLVLVLSLFLVVALPAADLEFSHQLHLGNGLTCTVCHSSAQQSQAETDHLLPRAELCLACHNGQTAPDIDVTPLRDSTTVERLFRFSHANHLERGNPAVAIAEAIDSGAYLGFVPEIREHLNTDNSCVGCHRGLEDAVTVDSSIHLPRMSDCLVCHNEIDNPFTCDTCHAPGFTLKPTTHLANFIDIHSSGDLEYDSRTCEVCHARKFTCMGCH